MEITVSPILLTRPTVTEVLQIMIQGSVGHAVLYPRAEDSAVSDDKALCKDQRGTIQAQAFDVFHHSAA